MHLKRLILCSLSVRNIFACHGVAIIPKSPKPTESIDCRFEASLVYLRLRRDGAGRHLFARAALALKQLGGGAEPRLFYFY